ncbi:hypothetical protein SAMN00790413_05768 [Deinococcus hopiensis KR-140]|uniref:Uncharacterized protein n=1 Tax=Deinococcus hopiensis KR-140 TaxID=695939 RepID=A0A1W1UEA3_9DEIO|nr:hypothetical protein SAMN00790413_05768 [Deinococcus hopiensis KR-140]
MDSLGLMTPGCISARSIFFYGCTLDLLRKSWAKVGVWSETV